MVDNTRLLELTPLCWRKGHGVTLCSSEVSFRNWAWRLIRNWGFGVHACLHIASKSVQGNRIGSSSSSSSPSHHYQQATHCVTDTFSLLLYIFLAPSAFYTCFLELFRKNFSPKLSTLCTWILTFLHFIQAGIIAFPPVPNS